VSFNQIPLYFCGSTRGTFQIVLHECTGFIDVFISSKPACTAWLGGTAVLGVHNLTGNSAQVVANRNSTQWTVPTSNPEGWRFSPNPAIQVPPNFQATSNASPPSVLCAGDTVRFTADPFTGASYFWVRPNGQFFSSLRNPLLLGASMSDTGNWTLYVVLGGCTLATRIVPVALAAPTFSSQSQIACEQTIWNGQTYTQSGTYSFTTVNSRGCDSVASLQLTINPSDSVVLSRTLCAPDSFLMGGQWYRQTGVYSSTLINRFGCDSVVQLNLTVHQPSVASISRTICFPGTFIFNNQALGVAGIYTATFQNRWGCDSVVTLTLTVNQPTQFVLNEVICAPDTFVFLGQSLTTGGSYNATLTNSLGCDSFITLNLVVNPYSQTQQIQTVCDSLQWNGRILRSTGSYRFVGVNYLGCDSLVDLQLTVHYSNRINQTISACDSFRWNGQLLTQSGVYSTLLMNQFGCDSIVTLNLNIGQTTIRNFTRFGCDRFVWQGIERTQTGIYRDTTIKADGCDSINVLLLTIDTTPVAPAVIDTQVCVRLGLPIQYGREMTGRLLWYADAGLINQVGEGNLCLLPNMGERLLFYLVFVSAGGCVSPASEYKVTNVNRPPPEAAANFFSPNADSFNDLWKIDWSHPMDLKIFDRWGMLIHSDSGTSVSWDGGNKQEGSYYYILSYAGCNGPDKTRQGVIFLRR
jgi:gliding motility-associated-like protein